MVDRMFLLMQRSVLLNWSSFQTFQSISTRWKGTEPELGSVGSSTRAETAECEV